MKILRIHQLLKNENANQIKNWFLRLSPKKRKIYFKYLSKRLLLNDFYKYLLKNKISRYFYMRRYSKTISFNKNFLRNFYIMLSFNPYNIDCGQFYRFWNLNKDEINYIDQMMFVEDDFTENKHYHSLVKGVCKKYYKIEHILEFLNIKYKDPKEKKIYWDLKSCFDYLKYHNPDNLFSIRNVKDVTIVEDVRDSYLDEIIKKKFDMDKLKSLENDFKYYLLSLTNKYC